jgi:MFS family permease
MLETYRRAFRVRGTAQFTSAGFVMRMPIAIYPLTLVLLMSITTGHYAFGGLLSGVYVVGNGIGNPVLGRLIDRFGQGHVLLPATAVHVAAAVALGLLVRAGVPDPVLLGPAIVMGFSYLSVGSLTRARWSYMLAGRSELDTGYSIESVLDEVIFTAGPLIATVAATQIDPVLGLVIGSALVTAGAVWLRRLTDTEPPARAADAPPHRPAVAYRGMPLLILAAVGMGGMFAGLEVSAVAFCGQHGATGWSGLVLACFATGSALSGVLYGSRHWQAPLVYRFRTQAIVFSVLPLLCLTAWNVSSLAVIVVVVGLGIAPTLITGFSLVQHLVPSGSLTEGMSWLNTGLSVGYGAAAAVVGRIADAHGARMAFLVPIAFGVVMGGSAVALFRQCRPSEASQPATVGAV